jgi:group I intron endonuclease
MNIYTIYKAKNVINGKVYIGFTQNFDKRKKDHIKNVTEKLNNKHFSAFYEAIRKYGINNFSWEVLYQSKYREHTKNVMENYFILEYKSYCGFIDCKGYNLTLGGEGSHGRKCGRSTKNKIRKKALERFKDEKFKSKHSEIMKQWYENLTEEQKEETSKKISESLIGNQYALGMTYSHTEEAKEKISKSRLGKKPSKETVEKQKQSRTGKGMGERNSMADPENRKKVSESKIGRKKYINIELNKFKYCFPGTEPEGYKLISDI